MNKNAMNDDIIECKFYSTSLQTKWDELCSQINNFISKASSDFLWHKEKLKVVNPLHIEQGLPQHLISSTCFGDNIEDEWYIVYLVLEITTHFESVVVQLTDNDGEFLLIEAANYLPNWIKPDNIENRVFVYQGILHIIPPELIDLTKNVTVENSIQIIMKNHSITEASFSIQSAIKKRVGSQPQDFKSNLHIAVASLPAEVAAILQLKPFLISQIVDAYCNHDIIDSKLCRDLLYDVHDCVQVKVTFTKCLYAMMLHSKLMKTKACLTLDKNDKKSVLGYKLTCGFKIIMHKLTKKTNQQKNFIVFIKSLTDNGYFKENIEGSKEYNSLLEKAKYYYTNTVNASEAGIAQMISNVMGTDEFTKRKEAFKDFSDIQKEDNEDWLSIHPDQLNVILSTRFGKEVNLKNDVTPETLTNELSRFLYQSSDLEGIEINEAENPNNGIEFDENEFVESIEKMINMVSLKGKDDEIVTDSSDDGNEDCSVDESSTQIDKEIMDSLVSDIIGQDAHENKKSTMENILRSLKEEEGYTGPSSNILKQLGINKKYLLDSDDDSE